MKKVITYGTFDLFHQGHANLLRRAKELGDYLIVGVTTDNFDIQRGKINTHDSLMTRIEAVRNSGYADQVILEEFNGQKISDIIRYNVDVFAIGSDWEGKFDYLKEYCQVVYLPRTEGVSSTMLRHKNPLRIGMVGTGNIAGRFADEARLVQHIELTAAYSTDENQCREFCRSKCIEVQAKSFEDLLGACDAVYVATPHFTHYDYVKRALLAGKHVLCETPFVLRTSEARELLDLASEKNLILMVAHKTAYCPAFSQLVFMVKSGVIGKVVDINASVTTITDENSEKMDVSKFGGSMNENACFPALPIVKMLGTDFRQINFYSIMKNGVDIYTKAVFRYDSATASFQVGLGAKTEGNMTISGTKGYIYVPAPWWKTDYFEMRFEDQNRNRKYFLPFDGEGLRYEIRDFAMTVSMRKDSCHADSTSEESVHRSIITEDEIMAMTRIQENYINETNLFKLK